jgi:hypothetical protein
VITREAAELRIEPGVEITRKKTSGRALPEVLEVYIRSKFSFC